MRLIDADELKTAFPCGESVRTECVMATIDHMPTIQPESERKRGRWIEFPNHMAYECSECGRIIQSTDGRRNVSKHYPFCHCGADMMGDSDDN